MQDKDKKTDANVWNGITVSLEMGKRLKDVWRKNRTCFKYITNPIQPLMEYWATVWFDTRLVYNDIVYDWLPAPTAQELLDALPIIIKDRLEWVDIWHWFNLKIIASKNLVQCNYSRWIYEKIRKEWRNLAEALWELYIRCEKNWYL